MKIGLIGIGLIAKKAYLPYITQMKNIDLHICTRNQATLKEIEENYKHPKLYSEIETWIESGIEAAFVHAATDAHEEIIDILLDHNIHVYVDKPITAHLKSTERLIEKANAKNLVLMTGFNRRYAPSYQALKSLEGPNFIICQKNVAKAAGEARDFIFNDFIHVLDTILYLFPYEIEDMAVTYKMKNEALHHVSVQMKTAGGTAIAIMNRDVGVSLEKVEVMSARETRVVENVETMVTHSKQGVMTAAESTWTPTLEKRGFHNIIHAFLEKVQAGQADVAYSQTDLRTHELAERIVQQIREK